MPRPQSPVLGPLPPSCTAVGAGGGGFVWSGTWTVWLFLSSGKVSSGARALQEEQSSENPSLPWTGVCWPHKVAQCVYSWSPGWPCNLQGQVRAPSLPPFPATSGTCVLPSDDTGLTSLWWNLESRTQVSCLNSSSVKWDGLKMKRVMYIKSIAQSWLLVRAPETRVVMMVVSGWRV